jgi:hypothetical protein
VTPEDSGLRFLDAAHVEHPSGTLGGLAVCTDENEQLGALDGVLIEPATRRVRYFVVGADRAPRGRYVLPADTPAVLDMRDRKLRVHAHAEDLERLRESVADFSDEDVFTAIFRSSAA